eukprot:jgi/Chlat1/7636/Chrsp64S07165
MASLVAMASASATAVSASLAARRASPSLASSRSGEAVGALRSRKCCTPGLLRAVGPTVHSTGGVSRRQTRMHSSQASVSLAELTFERGPSIGADDWLQQMVVEIVRQLPQAPFLKFLYSKSPGKSKLQQISEAIFARPDGWDQIKGEVKEAMPDGIILVHELDLNDPNASLKNEGALFSGSTAGARQRGARALLGATKVWGIVVQSPTRKQPGDHDCYMLSTTTTRPVSARLECNIAVQLRLQIGTIVGIYNGDPHLWAFEIL